MRVSAIINSRPHGPKRASACRSVRFRTSAVSRLLPVVASLFGQADSVGAENGAKTGQRLRPQRAGRARRRKPGSGVEKAELALFEERRRARRDQRGGLRRYRAGLPLTALGDKVDQVASTVAGQATVPRLGDPADRRSGCCGDLRRRGVPPAVQMTFLNLSLPFVVLARHLAPTRGCNRRRSVANDTPKRVHCSRSLAQHPLYLARLGKKKPFRNQGLIGSIWGKRGEAVFSAALSVGYKL